MESVDKYGSAEHAGEETIEFWLDAARENERLMEQATSFVRICSAIRGRWCSVTAAFFLRASVAAAERRKSDTALAASTWEDLGLVAAYNTVVRASPESACFL
jgi:hypothetical protein